MDKKQYHAALVIWLTRSLLLGIFVAGGAVLYSHFGESLYNQFTDTIFESAQNLLAIYLPILILVVPALSIPIMLVQSVHRRLRTLGLHWTWTVAFSIWVYLFADSLVHIYLRPHNNPDYVAYLSPAFGIFALSFVIFLAFAKPLNDKGLDFGQSVSWVASGVLAILSILTGPAFRLWIILPTFLVLLIYILTRQHKSSQISRYFKINKIPYVYPLNTKAVLHLAPLTIAGYYLYSATYRQNWF